ncbi:MAG: hypothetical protein R2849_11065 [Thermomicrobiales bacterium]
MNTLMIDARMPVASSAPASFRADLIERRIDRARMTATLESDWDQLHVRSRAMSEQITSNLEPDRQIAAARQLRRALRRGNDTLGLRALRLAAAAPMTGWLRHDETRAEAHTLREMFENDQRRGIPGLEEMEHQLARARESDAGRPAVAEGARS